MTLWWQQLLWLAGWLLLWLWLSAMASRHPHVW